ncbi:MAG: hypothetical protein JSR73_07260 [Proteobacteria bacterium]|nr:hypothetical protein [Pseudomonadota bacterium]
MLEQPIAVASRWLVATSLSRVLQDVDWLVPAIQTLHIVAVAVLFSSSLLLTIGVLGRHARELPLARTAARFLPGLYWGLPVLLVSGALMITAEPERALPNPAFQLKMLLVLLASAATIVLARRVRLLPDEHRAGAAARIAALLALALWLAALVAGRFIAYTLIR